tara:strand:- start:184 stop:510 length:327 start_codon:yes stop_codon:yes gene_type:complete
MKMVFLSDDHLICVIVSGRRQRIDIPSLKRTLGAKHLALASKVVVKERTGHEIGRVPLVNRHFNYVIDHALMDYDYIYGGTGEGFYTLKIKPENLLVLNRVILITDTL